MKVLFKKNEMLLQPETDFEEQVVSEFNNCTAMLKHGSTATEIIGIVIRQEEPKKVS